LIGAAILVPLEEATNAAFGGAGTGVTYVIYGFIILLVARFEPGGVMDLVHRLRARIEARRNA
jgi:branched-chain amino acid transport system permease protein